MAVFFGNFLKPTDSGSWEQQYSITTGASDILIFDLTGKDSDGNPVHKVVAWYTGTDAITTSNYNGFPTGSIIFDQQAHTTIEKTGATTWVASAART